MFKQRGFTLIEMLVVVAIIGILSSVLLTALGPARDKAKDARIIQELNQVRSLAETLYDGTYRSLPDVTPSATNIANPDLKALADDITLQGGGLFIKKSNSGTTYIAYSQLNIMGGTPTVPATNFYCVDSSGRSGYTISTTLGSVAECPSQ